VAEHEDTRTEGMVVADLDLDLITVSRARPEPPGLSNLRPGLYARLAAEDAAAPPGMAERPERPGAELEDRPA
jgi:hypothetical protein